MIFEAIEFADKAHHGQYRKGTKLPYFSHLMNTMKNVYEMTEDEALMSAAILHDVMADTEVTLETIEVRFGQRVAEAVKGATEADALQPQTDKKASWKRRKEHPISYLEKEAPMDVLIVSLADKLDNISAIRADFSKLGDKLWSRFNHSKDKQAWYYQALSKVFQKRENEMSEKVKSFSRIFKENVKNVF
ncbi:MAG TPA: bifunctional (p)ppGpp synthetase/guanosine-3',5'-bis(diphosphate) 3'-pyrophosphohydrolase [Candidatus Marinimicrobia bacterium]|nr:bifunctional (p)ppGpp synthetase/guanosine-3',5'-bis(diphosphate) 3'-pyrophosphohydrolase [Candidatus Neomarinimicrobiota bacterium]